MNEEINKVVEYFNKESFFRNDNWKTWNNGMKFQKHVRDDGSLKNGVKKWHGFDNER